MSERVHPAKISNGVLTYLDRAKLNSHITSLFNGDYEVIIRPKRRSRTSQQNKSMHLYFELLADALNSAGFDMKKTLREDIDIPWNANTIKEHLWRPVQEVYLKKQSTTELETKDIDKIYDIVNRAISERCGVSVPFPSVENNFDV